MTATNITKCIDLYKVQKGRFRRKHYVHVYTAFGSHIEEEACNANMSLSSSFRYVNEIKIAFKLWEEFNQRLITEKQKKDQARQHNEACTKILQEWNGVIE